MNDDDEIKDDLEDGDKMGRIPRKKHALGDDLLDSLDPVDAEDVAEETDEELAEETDEDKDPPIEDEY